MGSENGVGGLRAKAANPPWPRIKGVDVYCGEGLDVCPIGDGCISAIIIGHLHRGSRGAANDLQRDVICVPDVHYL